MTANTIVRYDRWKVKQQKSEGLVVIVSEDLN